MNFTKTLTAIATDLYKDVGTPDGKARLNVTLEFDSEYRVSKVDNLTVNDLPKVPSFDVMELISNQTKQFNNLPEKHKPKAVKVIVENGKINTDIVYRD